MKKKKNNSENSAVPWSTMHCSAVIFHCGVKQVAQIYQLCPQQKGTSAYIITGGNLMGIVGKVLEYSRCSSSVESMCPTSG